MDYSRIFARVGKWLGVASAVGTLCFWVYCAYMNQCHPGSITADAWSKTIMMALVATAGVLAAFQEQALLVILIFLFSFFPVGLTMLSVPSILRLIGICNLLFLFSGILMFLYREKNQVGKAADTRRI